MKLAFALAALVCASPAWADEKPVPLKNAPERDMVAANCGACHTLDYIRTNAPFMDRPVWTAEVNKMITAFGAPIAKEDAAKITDYLVKNYGK